MGDWLAWYGDWVIGWMGYVIDPWGGGPCWLRDVPWSWVLGFLM